jgi:hypothetical protein
VTRRTTFVVRTRHIVGFAPVKARVILRRDPGIRRALGTGVKTLAAILSVVAMAVPSPARAEPDAMLVALADPALAEPRPFKSQMHLTERIEARDRVFARLLLDGRVMLLAREGARLTITEVRGASTIDVASGRVAVTVDRERLRAEDLVEIRTPHAVVTVPSGTLVVEVADASTFTAIGRPIDVFRLDPASGAVLEPPTAVARDELLIVQPARTSSGVVANR